MPLAIIWDAPAFSNIFGTSLKLEKGKGKKELQSYNSPFHKYPSHADVSLLTHFANYLLKGESPSLYPQVFWASGIFSLWRRKGFFTAAVGQLLEQEDLCNTAMDKQAQSSERAFTLSKGEVLLQGSL